MLIPLSLSLPLFKSIFHFALELTHTMLSEQLRNAWTSYRKCCFFSYSSHSKFVKPNLVFYSFQCWHVKNCGYLDVVYVIFREFSRVMERGRENSVKLFFIANVWYLSLELIDSTNNCSFIFIYHKYMHEHNTIWGNANQPYTTLYWMKKILRCLKPELRWATSILPEVHKQRHQYTYI